MKQEIYHQMLASTLLYNHIAEWTDNETAQHIQGRRQKFFVGGSMLASFQNEAETII